MVDLPYNVREELEAVRRVIEDESAYRLSTIESERLARSAIVALDRFHARTGTELSKARARIAELEKALEPQWKTDAWGYDLRAAYVGGVYCGSIMPGSSRHHAGEWRGWFMHDDEGDETGWFTTADEARKSVEDKIRAALAEEKREGRE